MTGIEWATSSTITIIVANLIPGFQLNITNIGLTM